MQAQRSLIWDTQLNPNLPLHIPATVLCRQRKMYLSRGVPAYTQSTQLRTLIFECPKNKNVLNREKCNKNMPHPG